MYSVISLVIDEGGTSNLRPSSSVASVAKSMITAHCAVALTGPSGVLAGLAVGNDDCAECGGRAGFGVAHAAAGPRRDRLGPRSESRQNHRSKQCHAPGQHVALLYRTTIRPSGTPAATVSSSKWSACATSGIGPIITRKFSWSAPPYGSPRWRQAGPPRRAACWRIHRSEAAQLDPQRARIGAVWVSVSASRNGTLTAGVALTAGPAAAAVTGPALPRAPAGGARLAASTAPRGAAAIARTGAPGSAACASWLSRSSTCTRTRATPPGAIPKTRPRAGSPPASAWMSAGHGR